MKSSIKGKEFIIDFFCILIASFLVGTGSYFFQNSNNFAPGGVGGLATITYYLCRYKISWSLLMILFNVPIFILVAIFVNKKIGFILIIYMVLQSAIAEMYKQIGLPAYCLKNNPDDYEAIFACIMTGVILGLGYSIMLRHFGASGGTYAITALIKKRNPAINIVPLSFIMDASVVCISFFVYGMKITPVICTLINLFISNLVVDQILLGAKNGYKFEIITNNPNEISLELLDKTKHGATQINVMGVYSHEDKYLIVCIVRKKQVGDVMKIIKNYSGSFASVTKINEVFGKF